MKSSRLNRLLEVGRALTRLLNAILGGEGDTTTSADSYRLYLEGKWSGKVRVCLIDWINREPGHCRKAYEWHREHRLFERD